MGLIQGGDADSWAGEGALSFTLGCIGVSMRPKQNSTHRTCLRRRLRPPRQSFTSPVTAAGVILGLSHIGKDIMHCT